MMALDTAVIPAIALDKPEARASTTVVRGEPVLVG